MIADAVLAVRFVQSRRFDFTPQQIRDELGWSRRTAYRWLATMEACGLVEHIGLNRWRRA